MNRWVWGGVAILAGCQPLASAPPVPGNDAATLARTFDTTQWGATGTSTGAGFGHAVASAGDINRDGFDDILVGAPWFGNGEAQEGSVVLYHGSASGLSSTPGWTFSPDRAQAALGYSVAGVGDVDGDDYPDVAVGLWNDSAPESSEGRVYLFRGSAAGLQVSPWWIGEGNAVQSHYGYSVAAAGDIDNDTFADFIVGAPGAANDGFFNPAKACVVYGGPTPALTQQCMQAEMLVSYGRFGTAVTGLGDLDGDGFDDIAIGAPHEQRVLFDQGVVYVYRGSSSGLTSPTVLLGPTNYGRFGASLAGGGDFDADGSVDLVVGAPSLRAEEDVASNGRVYVYRGGVTGVSSEPSAIVTSSQLTSQFGWDVDFAGDVDDNGYDDLLVGAPYHDGGETDEGRVHLFLSRASGVWDVPVTTEPDQANAHLGYAVARAGDVDGDAQDDVVFSAPDFDAAGGLIDAGRVIVFADLIQLDADDDGFPAATDCDDTEASVYPGAPEVAADRIDQDCDGFDACHVDSDADGYGSALFVDTTDDDCTDPGESANADDCDDDDASIYPEAAETAADGIDQDCDLGDDCFADTDGDGYGTETTVQSPDLDCTQLGESGRDDDCDDTVGTTHPDAEDVPATGVDEDCDGKERCHRDLDGDTYGTTILVLSVGDTDCLDAGESAWSTDCDDTRASIRPGAAEIPADGVDQNCDARDTCYADTDGDSYGSTVLALAPALSCISPGTSPNDDDCNDASASVNPSATEIVANGIDDNCNSSELCYRDVDGDDYGTAVTVSSADLRCDGYRESVNDDDCDDVRASVNPGATEIPGDRVDQDCTGTDACRVDADGDGYGTTSIIAGNDLDCTDPGEATTTTDCDDTRADVRPGATETIADGLDQDCDRRELCYNDNDRDRWGSSATRYSSDLDCLDVSEASVSGDCNDLSATVYPGATEAIGDNVDQSCDGRERCYTDADGDTYGALPVIDSANVSCADAGESSNANDCDDANAALRPGATEVVADGLDQDCSGGDRCYADSDRDGFGGSSTTASLDLDCSDTGESTASTDCDDTRAAVYPGATEIAANGLDDNCDGSESCYTDTDGDGFGVSTIRFSVDADCGDAGESANTGDCDDTRASVYPGAAETTANGLDDDCASGDRCYVDSDRDTYGSSTTINAADLDCIDIGEASRNGDCLDSNAAIHPGATEVPADGVDQNCDGLEGCNRDLDGDGFGTTTVSSSTDMDCFTFFADESRFTVNDASARFATAVSSAGDINADGHPDLVVGSPMAGATDNGAIFVYLGSAGGIPSLPTTTIAGPEANSQFGAAVAGAMDLNGDGFDDIAVGAPTFGAADEGVVYVFWGTSAGLATSAGWSASGRSGAQFGAAVAGAGDVDGDGFADLLIGAPAYTNGQLNEGAVALYRGSAAGLPSASSWFSESNLANARLGHAVAGVGRIDTDRFDDVAVTAPNGGTNNQGRLYLYLGAAGGLPATATRTAYVSTTSNRLGQSVAGVGDVNGDGFGDIASSNGTNALYVWHGSSTGIATAPNTTFTQTQTNTRFGQTVAGVGDLDRDGFDDVLFGASQFDGGETDEGRAFVYFGGLTGLSSARAWTDEADQPGALLGAAVAGIGDADGDGFQDFVIGASSYDAGYADEGALFVHLFRPDELATNALDCDDTDAAVHPGATEAPADDVDQDCDTIESCFIDHDRDSFGVSDLVDSSDISCAAAGESYVSTDCDDDEASRYPGATEIPADGRDQDCVPGDYCFVDADRDGFGTTPAIPSTDYDCADPGESLNDDDCNDTSAAAFPGTVETVADGIDSDCDQGELCFEDLDGDGYGTPVTRFSSDLDCTDAGESTVSTDCNDANLMIRPERDDPPHDGVDQDCSGSDLRDADLDGFDASFAGGTDCYDFSALAYPGASESVDGIDEDCDGLVDDGTEAYDDDGDGVTELGGDCDDDDPLLYPGAIETTTGIDDDCDGRVDEGTPYGDDDGDGYAEIEGDCDDFVADVHPSADEIGNQWDDDCDGIVDENTPLYDDDGDGFTDLAGDCDDDDASRHPAAPETANDLDDDCDGSIDENTTATDDDGDGWSEQDGDCDDTRAAIHPGASEWINGIDDDCDGAVDTDCDASDDDGDGLAEVEGDCDDTDAEIYPNAPETLDGRDQDCDGYVDDGTDAFDDDGDGYAELQGDCDDALAARSPAREELCTAEGGVPYDEDCDGTMDEGCDEVVVSEERRGCGCSTPVTAPWTLAPWWVAGVALMRRARRPLTAAAAVGAVACTEVQIREDREGELVMYPPWVDFGAVTVGGTVDVTRTARNVGDGVIEFTRGDCGDTPGVEVVGELDGVVVGWAGSDDNADYLDITFRYQPTTAGTLDSACTFDFTGGDVNAMRVGVYGRSALPGLRFVPAVVDFGGVQGTETATARLVNAGFASVTLHSIAEFTERFRVDGPPVAGVTLAPGDSIAFDVTVTTPEPTVETFAVRSSEGFDATIELRANECSATLTVDDRDGDGATACGGDCDDTDPTMRPGLPEAVDGKDQDCNGKIDDRTDVYDDDGDGFAEVAGDCNDSDHTVFPGSTADRAGIDQNCDGVVEGVDRDGDGYTELGGDCDDDDATRRPGVAETADGRDEDCDETVDEGTLAFDDDGDGFTEIDGDCDDGVATVYPGALEALNGRDDDCDAAADEGTSASDDDADGFSEAGGDCDDADPTRNPAVLDPVGGVDADCDGTP